VFVLFNGQPAGRGSTSGGLVAGGEGAEVSECFESSIDTVALDVTVKEAPYLILRQSVAGGLDCFANAVSDGIPVDMPKRRAALA
jgi:hypothetical protein